MIIDQGSTEFVREFRFCHGNEGKSRKSVVLVDCIISAVFFPLEE